MVIRKVLNQLQEMIGDLDQEAIEIMAINGQQLLLARKDRRVMPSGLPLVWETVEEILGELKMGNHLWFISVDVDKGLILIGVDEQAQQPVRPSQQPTGQPAQQPVRPSQQPTSQPAQQPVRPSQQPTGQPAQQPVRPSFWDRIWN